MSTQGGDGVSVGTHLWRIIQQHLDDYGVTEAEFARRIGTKPQTVNSWKKRGIRMLPDKHLLVGVSDVTRRPYDEVIDAVLHDIGYLPKEAQHDSPTIEAAGTAAKPTPIRKPGSKSISDEKMAELYLLQAATDKAPIADVLGAAADDDRMRSTDPIDFTDPPTTDDPDTDLP